MKPGYLLQSAESCLISSLSLELAKCSDEDLSQTVVILPTQRLATYLLGQIARLRGAFRPPMLTTLESLIWQEASHLHPCRPVSDSVIDFLFQHRLQQDRFEQLRIGHERELRLILGELFDHNLREEGIERLKVCLKEDIYKNDRHVGSLFRRAEEIEQIFQEVEEELAKRNLAHKSKIIRETAAIIAPLWKEKQVLNAKKIVLAGYTSLIPSWRPLVEAIASWPDNTIWLADSPQLYHRTSPLKELNRFLEQIVSPQSIEVTKRSEPKPVKILEMASPYLEVQGTVTLCKRLIDSGHDPSKIAILVTNEAYYQKYLRSQIKIANITANIALSLSLRDTTVGQWIIAFRDIAEKGLSLTRLMNWLNLPITETWWRAHEDWQNFNIEHLIESLSLQSLCNRWIDLLKRFQETPYHDLLHRLYQLSLPFASSEPRSVATWFELWNSLMKAFSLVQAAEPDYEEAMKDAFKKFEDIQNELVDYGSINLKSADFWNLIHDHFLSIEVRSLGEPLAGVQVLSLSESRFFPFDTVFILGCNEGTFPKAVPQDELLDDYLKRKMGLPGWEALESMEDQTFHLLKERIPQLVLTRCLYRNQEPQVRSRFIEKLLTEGEVEILTISSQDDLFKSLEDDNTVPLATMERTQNSYIPACLEGQLPTPAMEQFICRGVSASSLEKLIRCPYRYLLDRLGIRDLKPLPFDDDVRLEGEWLHGVLEAFFTGRYQGQVFKDVLEYRDEPDFHASCCKRLLDLTIALGPSKIEETPLYYQLVYHSWPAFVDHVFRLYDGQWHRLKNGKREASFGGSNCDYQATFTLNGQTRTCYGRIDSIDHLDQLVVITDYKRQSTPDKKTVRLGISPQLSFYAHALIHSGLFDEEEILVGYWNIVKGEWVPIAVGEKAKAEATKRGLLKGKVLDLADIRRTTEEMWSWRETHIKDRSRYYADPSECGLCSYKNICRRNDPTLNQSLLDQSFFKQSLGQKVKEEVGTDKVGYDV